MNEALYAEMLGKIRKGGLVLLTMQSNSALVQTKTVMNKLIDDKAFMPNNLIVVTPTSAEKILQKYIEEADKYNVLELY